MSLQRYSFLTTLKGHDKSRVVEAEMSPQDAETSTLPYATYLCLLRRPMRRFLAGECSIKSVPVPVTAVYRDSSNSIASRPVLCRGPSRAQLIIGFDSRSSKFNYRGLWGKVEGSFPEEYSARPSCRSRRQRCPTKAEKRANGRKCREASAWTPIVDPYLALRACLPIFAKNRSC